MFADIKNVYNRLADEESKYIFVKRLQYAFTGDIKDFVELLDGLKNDKEYFDGPHFLDLLINPEKYRQSEFVLFGTGDWGRPIYDLMRASELDVICFCDNSSSKVGNTFCDKEIIPPKTLVEKYFDKNIVISSEKYDTDILNQLLNLGFTRNQIFRLKISNSVQYFDNDIVMPQENEVFIDGGFFDGETSLDFISWTGSVKKVYAFEPDANNISIAGSNISKLNKTIDFELIEKGLWSSDTELKFSGNNTVGSKIDSNGEIIVKVTSIDSAIPIEEQVSFIKLDIEGAELEALIGAEKTIKRCKPRMAICIYHKPEDILDIVSYVAELLPNFELYIRHYIPYFYDTILYAVPKNTEVCCE